MDIKLPKGYSYIRRLGQGGQAIVILGKEIQEGESTSTPSTPTNNASNENQQSMTDASSSSYSTLNNQDSYVAIKCYVRSSLKDPVMFKRVKREIRHLKLLDHPHIIGEEIFKSIKIEYLGLNL